MDLIKNGLVLMQNVMLLIVIPDFHVGSKFGASPVWRKFLAQYFQEGRFPGSVFTNDRGALSSPEIKRDMFK